MAIGLVFTNLGSFLFLAFLARLLGPADFGLYTLGFSVFGIVSALALLGLDKAILRFVTPVFARGEIDNTSFVLKRILKYMVWAACLVGGLLFIYSDHLADGLFKKPEAGNVIRIFSLCILPFVLSMTGYNALQALRNIRHQVLARNFIEPGLKLAAISFLFFLPSMQVWMAIVVLAGAFTGGAFYSWWRLSIILKRSGKLSDAEWSDRRMLAYSLPLFLTALLNMGLFRLDVIFLGRFGTPEDVGLYGAAFQLAALGAFGMTVANLVFSPFIAASYHNGKHELLAQLFRTVSRWVLMLTLPLLGLVVLYPSQIISLYGEGFRAGASALLILAIGQTLNNLGGISGSVLAMSGHSRAVLGNSLLTCLFAAASCTLLIPRFGISGAAAAAAATVAVLAGLRFFFTYRLVGLVAVDLSTIKPLLAAGVALFPIKTIDRFIYSPVDWHGVLLIAPLYLITFGLLLSLLGWHPDDLLALRSVASRLKLSRADR